jgi:hypothetical protein
VLVVRFGHRGNPVPQYLTPVAVGSYFDIYRVIGPGAGSHPQEAAVPHPG